MKRVIGCLMALMVLGGLCLSGCTATSPSEDGVLQIVTTVFPIDDWVSAIVKGSDADTVRVHTLADRGVDMHNYQPTTKDILLLSSCDVFIYVGGASDAWVEDVLASVNNPNMVVINLLDALGSLAKHELTSDEMGQGHDHDHDHDHDHGQAETYDEHIWLSLKNAVVLCDAITDVLCDVNSPEADAYRANMAAYQTKLVALDGAYQAALNEKNCDTVVFADRFPFRYLLDDYGISYDAAFPGCSTDSEASIGTILALAEKIDALDLSYVLILEGQSRELAETVVRATKDQDQTILSINSMQTVIPTDKTDGEAYLSIMEDNLTVLCQALGAPIRSEVSEADTVEL